MGTKVYCTECFIVWPASTLTEPCPYCKAPADKVKLYPPMKKLSDLPPIDIEDYHE